MGSGNPLDTEITSRLATKLSKISHEFSIICYIFGNPAGLINCFKAFSPFPCKPIVNVHDIVVVEEFRGQSISLFCYLNLKTWLSRKTVLRLR